VGGLPEITSRKDRIMCKDTRVRAFQDLGYNVLRVPHRGVRPLDVVGVDGGKPCYLGSLAHIWHSSMEPPVPSEPEPAVAITGTRTDALNLSLGLSLLGGILHAMGADLPSLSVAYRRASLLQFEFENVTSRTISALAVGEFISAGDMNAKNPFHTFFTDKDKSAWVTTEVLESDRLSVVSLDRNGNEIGADVPALNDAVSGNLQITSASNAATKVRYQGSVPLAFAFRAVRMHRDEGVWAGSAGSAAMNLSFAPSNELILTEPFEL
jgi:hypothetical protein